VVSHHHRAANAQILCVMNYPHTLVVYVGCDKFSRAIVAAVVHYIDPPYHSGYFCDYISDVRNHLRRVNNGYPHIRKIISVSGYIHCLSETRLKMTGTSVWPVA
jgi:hypothetical protein